jgi:hypothetical protein
MNVSLDCILSRFNCLKFPQRKIKPWNRDKKVFERVFDEKSSGRLKKVLLKIQEDFDRIKMNLMKMTFDKKTLILIKRHFH